MNIELKILFVGLTQEPDKEKTDSIMKNEALCFTNLRTKA